MKFITSEFLAMHKVNVQGLRQGVKYPVVRSFLHNDSEVRAEVAVDGAGHTSVVTLPIAVFNDLPTAEVQ